MRNKILLRVIDISPINFSEALNCIEDIYRNGVFISDYDAFGKQQPTNISPETNKSITKVCDTIKSYIIIAEERKKVLDIIWEKNVDIKYFKKCKTVEKYNNYCDDTYKKFLTQEEFDLLKRYCDGKRN